MIFESQLVILVLFSLVRHVTMGEDFSRADERIFLGNSVLEEDDFSSLRSLSRNDNKYLASAQNPCTYFHGFRYPEPQSNLENCTWYSSNACCRRTEVTAVFQSMVKIDGATQDCKNTLNYLMCFWCSPDQYLWFIDEEAIVCEDFCDIVFQNCSTAFYNGRRILDAYKNGREFCEAQNFRINRGNELCFAFDKSVFSGAVAIRQNSLLEAATQALIVFRYLFLLEWIFYDTFVFYFLPERLYVGSERL